MAKVFRIFISSTFSDLQAERNALQDRVFPRLRELCLQHGYRFQAIDLRWGVSEAASRQQRTMQICLEELQRCQTLSPRPNFLVLLGDRYGWQPLPESIPKTEYDQLAQHLDTDAKRRFSSHYLLDHNAVDPTYILRDRSNEASLIQALSKAAEASTLPDDRHLCYGASATHQEIHHGAFQTVDPEQHVFVFARHFDNLTTLANNADAAGRYLDMLPCTPPQVEHDTHAYARLDQLRKNLKDRLKDHVIDYKVAWSDQERTPTGHLGNLPGALSECLALLEGTTPPSGTNLCLDLFLALGRTILAEIRRLANASVDEQEEDDHGHFADEAQLKLGDICGYLPRSSECTAIDDFFRPGTTGRVLAVVGPLGIGKSALLAHTASLRRSVPGWEVIQRYVGASPLTATGAGLLTSVNAALARLHNTEITAKSNGPRSLIDEFQERVRLFPSDQNLLLVLDGLDLLPESDPIKSELWIPSALPPNVRLLVSVDTRMCPALRHLLPACFYDPSPLCRTEGAALLDLWLSQSRRTLQDAQYTDVLNAADSDGLPLSLRIAFLRARRWTSFAPAVPCGSGLPGIVSSWLNDLQRDENHGPVLTQNFIALLNASREGLTEDELMDLLSSADVLEDFIRLSPNSPDNFSRLPVAPWVRLYADAAPLLRTRSSSGQMTIDFSHPALRSLMADHYLTSLQRHIAHTKLLSYFSLKDPISGIDAREQRALIEVPYQLAAMKRSDDLCDLLLRADYLSARLQRQGIWELLTDYALPATWSLPLSANHTQDVHQLEVILHGAARVLACCPEELLCQLHWRLEHPCRPALEALLRGLSAAAATPWIRLTNCSPILSLSPRRRTLEGHTQEVRHIALLLDGQLLASSADDHTLNFRNLSNLGLAPKSVSFPDGTLADMAVSPCGRYLITGAKKGTIRVWASDGGQLAASSLAPSTRIQSLTVTQTRLVVLTKDGYLLTWLLPAADAWEHADFSERSACIIKNRPTRPDKVLASSPIGSTLYFVDTDGGLWMVDPDDPTGPFNGCLRQGTSDFRATSLLVQPQEGRLWIGCHDGSLWSCQIDSASPIQWLLVGKIAANDTHVITALAAAADGTLLYAGTDKGRIVRFALKEAGDKHAEMQTLVADGETIYTLLAYGSSDEDASLIYACNAPHIQIIPTTEMQRSTAQDIGKITALTTGTKRNGRLAIAAGTNGTLYLFDLIRKQRLSQIPVHAGQITSVAISPDERYLIAGAAYDSLVACVDTEQPQKRPTFSAKHDGCIQCLLPAPTMGAIFSINDRDQLCVYALPGMIETKRLDFAFHDFAVTAATAVQTSAGWFLVTGSQSGQLAVCDHNWELRCKISLGHRRICAITPAGLDEILVGTDGGDMVRYSVGPAGLVERTRYAAHPSAIVAISMLGDTGIVTACRDGCLRLWHAANGSLVSCCTLDAPLSGSVANHAETILISTATGEIFIGDIGYPIAQSSDQV